MGKDKVISMLGHVAGKVTGKSSPEVVEEITAMGALQALSKEARSALKRSGTWQQEYHGSEIVAAIAVMDAQRKVLKHKEDALGIAIEFIGSLEVDQSLLYGDRARKALEDINQALVGETIDESIRKKNQ